MIFRLIYLSNLPIKDGDLPIKKKVIFERLTCPKLFRFSSQGSTCRPTGLRGIEPARQNAIPQGIPLALPRKNSGGCGGKNNQPSIHFTRNKVRFHLLIIFTLSCHDMSCFPESHQTIPSVKQSRTKKKGLGACDHIQQQKCQRGQ